MQRFTVIKTFKDFHFLNQEVELSDIYQNIENIYISDFDSENYILIDSFDDLLDIVPKDLVDINSKTTKIVNRYSKDDNGKSRFVFSICPTYHVI